MQDLRLVLIILGFIAIVALIAHGLWSNKKNEVKPLKDKPLGKLEQNVKDNQGFDLDGIGEKRVVTKSVEPTMNLGREESTPVEVEKIEPQFSRAINNTVTKNSAINNSVIKNSTVNTSGLTSSFSATDVEGSLAASETNAHVKNDLSYDVVSAEVENSVEDEPATQDDEVIRPVVHMVNDSVIATAVNSDEIERNIQAVDHAAMVIEAAREDSAVVNTVVDTTAQSEEALPDEAVFVINIMAREGKSIAGAELLQELSAFGFKFGAMDIFHRHVDAAGKGAVIFSLANMVKPGTFDIDTMEQFESPGVSLFMMFPCAGQASHNYGLMLSAAERIADGVDGLLMDGSRHPLTEESIEQEQVFIRKLENRSLTK
ncbi:cell division protein ZipA [Moritella sp. F3]|uniref:cell division protein ZipA n=1 Tax=Moritella sp. F3 TaxID=2718882 RepID=UPI0018E0E17B|nr:cell division protein ZipA [Moritella sp. F3]GIC79267.1 cell division protein ZipA [Moritella sp. F1]GIC80375.1 cell division protein ZipA [Moritella sp. F3]